MLYKTFESYPMVYQGIPFNVDPSSSPLYAPPREYMEAMTAPYQGGVVGAWTRQRAMVGYDVHQSTIYAICQVTSPDSWDGTWRYVVGQWDGFTGDFLDYDRNTWSSLWGWLYGTNFIFIQDDVGRVWVWDYSMFGMSGYLKRTKVITDPVSSGFAGQAGMPDLSNFDVTIADGEWKNEDGSLSDVWPYGTFRPLAISWRDDWLLATPGDQSPTGGDLPDYAKPYVVVYTLSTRRRRGFIRLRNTGIKGVSTSTGLVYIFGQGGSIEVLNISIMESLGILNYDLSSHLAVGTADAYTGNFAPAYDEAYRRLLVFNVTPDDPVTGACTSMWTGYAPREASIGVTKPLPLAVPREGKTIPVLVKAYGSGGTGIGGEHIELSINEEGGVIYPTESSSDATGNIYAQWVCGDQGIDNATISVNMEADQALPGLIPGTYTESTLVLPTYLEDNNQGKYFFPGWWLLQTAATRVKTQTAEQKFATYLSQVEDAGYSNQFQGALVEYSWYELEPTVGVYDFSKIRADLTYLKSLGMKMIVGIRVSGPKPTDINKDPRTECSPWIAPHIYNDTSGAYQESVLGEGYTGLTYTVFPTESSSYAVYQSLYPMLFVSSIQSAYLTLMGSLLVEFASDDSLIGVVPFDYPQVTSGAIERCMPYPDYPIGTYTLDDLKAAIINTYSQVQSLTTKLVFGYCTPTNNDWEGNYSLIGQAPTTITTWMKENGVGLLNSFWLTKYNSAAIGGAYSLFTSANSSVPTGIVIPDWCWTDPRNLNTAQEQSTGLDVLMGSASMARTGNLYWPVNQAYPWMCFIEPNSSVWKGSGGVIETTATRRLQKYAEFYG